jgi:hypothetical protein
MIISQFRKGNWEVVYFFEVFVSTCKFHKIKERNLKKKVTLIDGGEIMSKSRDMLRTGEADS